MRLALGIAFAVASMSSARPALAQPAALTKFEPPVEATAPIVELMTFGVGDVIFEKFGHAAICLRYFEHDPVCFNYGVTDFDAGPIMIWDFLRTQQKFWAEPSNYDTMFAFYEEEDRDIWAQTLPLTGTQARALEAKLWHSVQYANREYVYDHFTDNCSTRIRDMIDEVMGGALRANADRPYPLTFRQLGRRGLASLPNLIAFADFVLGRQLDEEATIWQAMFHPDVLRAHLVTELGVPAVQRSKRLGTPHPVDGPTGRLPMFIAALVFALPLAFAQWRRRFERLALAWATLPLALWGLAIWSLVILSSIKGVRWNEVALVLVPFDLALPFLSQGRRRAYARWRVIGLLFVSGLCAAGVLLQPLWIPILTAIIPLAIIAFPPHELRR